MRLMKCSMNVLPVKSTGSFMDLRFIFEYVIIKGYLYKSVYKNS